RLMGLDFSSDMSAVITTPEHTPQKRLLFAPMVVLGLLIAALVLEVSWAKSTLAGILILRQTETGWQRAPMSAGYFPRSRQISASGKVWTLNTDGFSRWDGSAWRHFNVNDFGSNTFMTSFAVDGEQVWAPTREGVWNWDGETWKIHNEVLTKQGASIVAGGGEVWILDREGN